MHESRSLAASAPRAARLRGRAALAVPVVRAALVVLVMASGLGLAGCAGDDKTGTTAPDAVARVDFGTPCDRDEACGDHVCVPHIANTVCSQACDASAPCPDGWSCWTPPPGPGDGRPASYCVSPFWSLCRPCTSDASCGGLASDGAAGCVDYLGAGAFCATACDDDAACPDGFACTEIETVAGGLARRCVEATGMCPCTPYLGRLGEPTRCASANTWGECAGLRTCDGAAWSACDAREAAADVPNGVDDDCDGATDELACACGDDVCDGACGETLATCPCDCAAPGDGVCSPCGESPLTAPVDCCRSATGTSGCGDGFCTGFDCGETPGTCPDDCGKACGDDACEPGESPYTCAEDCAHKVCGNHVCESTDGGPEACPQDCKPFCGDCTCDPARDESVFNCPIDCGYCGDGDCSLCANLGERGDSCPADCCVPHLETCDGDDDDCDGETDETDAAGCTALWRDHDGDGLGADGPARCLCAADGEWRAPVAGDCDDDDGAIGAGTAEVCDGEDDDCDGATDEDFDLDAACALAGAPCRSGRVACDGPDRTTCVDAGPAAAGTLCSPLACADGLITPPGVCDGGGSCVVLPFASCDGYACTADGRCKSACTTATDCRSGYACGLGGTCERVAPTCVSARECADEDWQTQDLCVTTCAHVPDDDVGPGDDADGDGVVNGLDLCPETADPLQLDADHDGRGDACDRCGGPGQAERCNGADDDCDGQTDEGFDVGATCRTAPTSCDAGVVACAPDGTATCAAAGAAPAGIACGPAACEGPGVRLAARCDGAGACVAGALVDCRGHVCAPASATPSATPGATTGEAACAARCDGPEGCRDGFWCDAGACAAERPAGAACDSAEACASGACVDGVCCTTPCDGPCQRCGADGVCAAAAPGTDPDGECAACATCDARGECALVPAGGDPKDACDARAGERCGPTGACDGAGGCALGEAGAPCSDKRCVGGLVADVLRCDGRGACGGASAIACPDGLACAADGSACLTACGADRDCIAGRYCDLATHRCQPLGELGQACAIDRACKSGVCADGLCCDAACDGGCVTCAAPGHAGRCTAEPADTDPEDACADCLACDGAGACAPVERGADPLGDCADDPAVCGATGLCDGQGACADDDVNVACGAARCVGDTAVSARFCTGRGACADATLTACVGARCDPVTGACKTTCQTTTDCQGGFTCAADHQCRPLAARGATCGGNAACASGFCVDGVCCEGPCAGPCLACEAGTGTCRGTAEGLEELGCTGLYHCAAGVCTKDDGAPCAAGSECGSTTCAGGVCCATACAGACESCAGGQCATADHAQVAGRCDGAMWCVAGGCVPIAGSGCGPGGACPNGLVCRAGLCALPASLGATCGGDGECGSGHCVDGVCCESTCQDLCHACGPSGRCAAVTGASSECGAGHACAPDGTCKANDGATCGDDADCASGHCPDGVCCGVACDAACESCATGTCLALTGPAPGEGCPQGEVCAGRGVCSHAGALACDAPADCPSGACVLLAPGFGFCCDTPCGGPCETCSASDPLGTCEHVLAAERPGRCESDKWCDKFGACVPKVGAPCATDPDCGPGTFCDATAAAPTCQPLRARGAACDRDADCQGGSCADGVCCDRACDGVCEACDLEGSRGTCALAATGTDPRGDCPLGETCSREQGGCARATGQGCAVDGECATDACVFGTCCDRGCDGLCESCDTGACALVTAGASDLCVAPLTCDAIGRCRQAAGTPCDAPAECASDVCDIGAGRCCPTGCTGACQTCTDTGACAAVASRQVPGRCDGASSCDVHGDCVPMLGAACAADPDCAAGFWCDRPANAPAGTCQARATAGALCGRDAACASGFCAEGRCCESACGGACQTCDRPGFEGRCVPALAGDDPAERCGAGRACAPDGACQGELGQACGGDAGCVSGQCAQGVCCGSACDGACERCDEPAHLGTCTAVASGTTFACPGPYACEAGVCLLGAGQACNLDMQCASHVCGESTLGGARVCCTEVCSGACRACAPGTGLCAALTRVEDPGQCSGAAWCDRTGACRAKEGSPCDAANDCASGAFCDTSTVPGVCRTPLPPGQSCELDAQCQTGICSQGKCCNERCDAACGTCGTGVCTLPAAGTDPFGRCPPGDTCAADGSCRDALGTSCVGDGSTCASGLCVDGRCCNSACATPCMTCDGLMPGYCDALAAGEDLGCSGPSVECRGGQCLGDIGAPCAGPAECASASCADHVCCDAGCAGACRACDVSGQIGHCTTLTRVEDQTCSATSWCDKNGMCAPKIGSPCGGDDDCPTDTHVCINGTCQKRGAEGAFCVDDGDCASGFCTDEVCCGVRCDGLCERCDATPGTCTGVIGPDADCGGAFACAGRDRCLLADGQTCGQPATCASGQCEDSVCCAGACGACQTCNAPGFPGLCQPIERGEDASCNGLDLCVDGICQPKAGGPCQSSMDCAADYYCDAFSACAPRAALGESCPAGAPDACREGQCVDGVCCSSPCVGECQSCAEPGHAGTCVSVANNTDDCAMPGDLCQGGQCLHDLGVGCNADIECASGQCADGVCCASDCDALSCYRCDAPGFVGQCRPLAAGNDGLCMAPFYACEDGACKLAQGAACGLGEQCATGQCVDGVCCGGACGPCQQCNVPGQVGTCATVTTQDTDRCNGGSWCDVSGQCLPFESAHCGVDLDCPGGFHCDVDGTCSGLAPNGASCGGGDQCQSGVCQDTVCCNAPCGGTCQNCNLAGLRGTCSPVVNGADPDSCAQTCDGTSKCTVAVGTCINDLGCPGGYCDLGLGTCASRVGVNGTCDRDPMCVSGHCDIPRSKCL